MKKVILTYFILFSVSLFSQQTYVPDDNFEQALINKGYDSGPLDDYVLTSNINSIKEIFLMNLNISDLTGIEDFTDLNHLQVNNNNLSTININNLLKLNTLSCENNNITFLNISNNINLKNLFLDNNSLQSLNTDKNILLSFISIVNNNIESLNFSLNTELTLVELNNNNLSFLDLRNNRNEEINIFNSKNNPNLKCIFVDTIAYSNTNWLDIDSTSFFVETEKQCDNISCSINVDELNDINTCNFFMLPLLNNGTFFTESGGKGMILNTGDIISNSQTIYIYNVDINDPDCFKESSFKVTICESPTEKESFPYFFTPNNDGVNDYWKIKSIKKIKIILIYNRFGKLLSSPIPEIGWDGLSNGKKVESNSYWYKIIFDDDSLKIGYFSLLRN